MTANRNWLNLTVLPTGEVLADGGTRVGTRGGEANAVRQAEVWNPATGGGGVPGPEDDLNAELHHPPYLFTRGADGVVRWASRPAVTSLAGSATHGGTITMTLADARAIRSASLIDLGTVTHAENTTSAACRWRCSRTAPPSAPCCPPPWMSCRRATFAAVTGNTGQGVSLQVWRDRTLTVRHQGYRFWAQVIDGSALALADSTFTVRTGLWPAPAA